MSQNNIGEFIQQSRKAKGFTQKDLGDRIGVSDKTISKWENGNSIPDTSILNELCATLDINVNELLSGEKLTPEIYSMKAEENMINLLEDNQKQQCFTLFPCAVGIVLLILTGLFAIMMLNGCTIAGMMYTQKLLVRCKVFMVMYIGIRPALKYMVITIKRYHSFLCHIRCWVNMNPR